MDVRVGPRRLSAWELIFSNCALESPLDYKEITPVNAKRNQPWILIGRTDADTEAPILWPSDVNSSLIGKDPDAGKDWGQEEKGAADDEIVRWHHRFSRHDSEQTQGRQGSLACCSPRARKQSDVTSWLKNNNYKISGHLFSMLTQEKVNLKIYVI